MDLDWYSITNDLKEVEDYEYNEDWGDPLPTMEQAQERIDKFKAKTKYPKYHSSK
jgi:GH25 family lysozyme M1 (1,4-beta-N-acetylmuramidase)